jgi:hypothetical protein
MQRELSRNGNGFVGSWRMTIFEEHGPPSLALATLGADGTIVAAEHPVVTPPLAPGPIFTSAGHGAWEATGPETANATIVGLGSAGEGSLVAISTARFSIRLGADGQSFSGDANWSVTDPDGNHLATFPLTLRATRVVAGVAEEPWVRPSVAARATA